MTNLHLQPTVYKSICSEYLVNSLGVFYCISLHISEVELFLWFCHLFCFSVNCFYLLSVSYLGCLTLFLLKIHLS